jgi:O-antigen/teichoic acid export membrane protein
LAIIFFVLILKENIFGAVLSNVIAVVGAALFVIFLVTKINKLYIIFNKKLLKDSISYGGRIYLANAASFFSYRLDMFMIAWLLNPEVSAVAVGFYSIAVAMAEKLFMIPGAFATVLFPKISSSNNKEADNFTPRVVRHTILIVFIFSLILAFLAKLLITILFGSAFLPSVAPLIILLPGIIAFSIGGVMAADLSGRGKPQFAVYSSIACIAVNFPLNLLLIPVWGINGAAFASTVAYSIDTSIIIWAFLKISKRSLKEVLIIQKQDFQDYLKILSNFKNFLQIKK